MMSAFSNGLPGKSADFALAEKQTLQTDADVGTIRGYMRMWSYPLKDYVRQLGATCS